MPHPAFSVSGKGTRPPGNQIASTMSRLILISFVLLSVALRAADTPPAIASLTYSGDQAALVALDAELATAGQDTANLAALETRLLAILRRSDATFAARQAICQRLGAILAQSAPKATTDGYKPLGTMLLDDRDSDLARLALDPAPGAVVESMFTGALAKTSGRTRLALIDTLARRRVGNAVPALTGLLSDKDGATATAAARALGEIGTPAAEAALRAAKNPAPATVGQARLQATSRLPAADAQRVSRELQDDKKLPAALRAAAFRRSLDLDQASSAARIASALATSDWLFKQVALEAASEALTPDRAGVLIAKLATWDSPTQAAVIAILARAGEVRAVPAVVVATKHASAGVRTEAFAALGFLPGNRDIVTLLATAAAGGENADVKTARQSLTRLNGPGVAAAILEGAEHGAAGLRPVFLDQLAQRHMTESLPLLLKCRTEAQATIRAAAVGALGDLAPFSEQPAVLAWAIAAADEGEQTRALRALVNVTLRNPAVAERGRAIYAALAGAEVEIALRLMPVLTRLGGAASADCAALLAVRNDAKVATAAAESLGRWSDVTAVPALVTVAETAAVPSLRNSARESAIRSLERTRDRWTPSTTALVARLLASTTNAIPRRQLLALLARASDQPAVDLAETLQADPTLGEDARYAAAAIKAALAGAPILRAAPAAGISNATDGKTSTRWSAPSHGEEWVEIDFRVSRPLRRLTLDQTGRAAEFPEHFEVHVTDDPETPGPVIVKGQGQRNKTVIDLRAGTKGRYVIIKNTAERKDTPWAICELYVD